MSTGHILLLGAIAGLTIFIGLPMGRLHDVGQSFKAFLSATATGILLFLFWDVLVEAIEPVEDALNARDWGQFSGYSALAFGGFAVGLLSLVYYDTWMKARRRKSFLGPGAASATELERSHFVGLTPARWLALFIATGIGLHNFSEGLAIGQAAALDKLSLAYVLVIGFGLHNATEGFGIVAPLTGDAAPGTLSVDQQASLARVTAALDSGGGHFLLYGPTGSGKTEVYLQAAAAALERGLGAIVLVPEIALAPQTVGRFRARFGDSVAILHSALTEAERRDERERIARGEARVVVGARSAIFAPMHGLGLICVDEEHDPSFKQESDPRYDARTVAAKRASLEGAVALYGSATPRPESWERLPRPPPPPRPGGEPPPG